MKIKVIEPFEIKANFKMKLAALFRIDTFQVLVRPFNVHIKPKKC
jgi:hypothetical protein